MISFTKKNYCIKWYLEKYYSTTYEISLKLNIMEL